MKLRYSIVIASIATVSVLCPPGSARAATVTKPASQSSTAKTPTNPAHHHSATASSAHHTGVARHATTAAHHRHSPGKTSAANKSSVATSAASKQKTTGKKTKPQHSTAYTRLAHMQMDPSRVQDIQQALIAVGALEGSPTGRWDDSTRVAMSHYQAAHGFGVTGLPDAKSLMKLGLGPHPLPPQLDNPANGATASEPMASMPANTQLPIASPAPARNSSDPKDKR